MNYGRGKRFEKSGHNPQVNVPEKEFPVIESLLSSLTRRSKMPGFRDF
jgi:hypothetical protein